MSPKAAETRALLRLMNDGVHMAKQLSQLLNIKKRQRQRGRGRERENKQVN